MRTVYLLLLGLMVSDVKAYITVGTDGNCMANSTTTTIQSIINSGETDIRVTNQQVIHENLSIDESVMIRGGFNNCIDAENFVMSPTKTEFNGGNTAPVLAINSPNNGDDINISLINLSIRHGLNEGDHHGGGVSVYDLNNNTIQLTIEDSLIQNNVGTRGGGLYLRGSQITANLLNTLIINNLATSPYNGYAIGGGVYCHSADFTLNHDSGIVLNQAYSANQLTGHGGGIYATDNCDISILSGTDGGILDFRGINNNSASTHGGGILLTRQAYLSVDSTVYNTPININNNFADSNHSGNGNGGGVFISNSASMYSRGLKLHDNQAVNGGGVYLANNGLFTMSFTGECGGTSPCNFFSGNEADQNNGKGGLAYVDDAEFYLNYAYATENKADSGSVIYTQNNGRFRSRASIIYNNGGNGWTDEHVINMENSELYLTNVTLAMNHAVSATIRQLNGYHDIFASIIYEPITNQMANFIGTSGVKNCLMVDNNFGIGSGISNIYIDDPEFLDMENQDFHLSVTSPAVDACAANAPGLNPLQIDVDGEEYEFDHPEVTRGPLAFIDIGADELHVIDFIYKNGFEPIEN